MCRVGACAVTERLAGPRQSVCTKSCLGHRTPPVNGPGLWLVSGARPERASEESDLVAGVVQP